MPKQPVGHYPKKKRGAPRKPAELKRVHVTTTLLPRAIRRLKIIGKGKVSTGLRIVAELATKGT